MIATIAILDAAFERWPVPAAWWGPRSAALLCTVPLLLLMMGFDHLSRRKVHAATIWGSLLVVTLQQSRYPIGHSALFQAFAALAQTYARSWHI